MTDEPLSLGALVRSARESAGLTVEQVSASTRIRSTLLRDLEQGQTGSSGGAVYVRGHLKAIAAATSTDPAPLLRAFEREAGLSAPPELVAAAPMGSFPGGGSLRLSRPAVAERRGPRWGAALLAAVAVLVGLMAVGIWGPQDAQVPPADDLAVATAPPPPAASTAPSPSPAPVGPSAVASIPAPTGAALRVRAVKGKSWVNVASASGETLFRGVLSPGTAKDFSDPKRLAVTVGNAGAINLICGGKDVAAGKDGQVRKYTCAAKGLVPA